MDIDDLPPQGRVGLALSGPFQGRIVFLFYAPDSGRSPEGELESRWGWWTSLGHDFMLPRDLVEETLGEADFYWFSEPEDSLLESAIFALRPLGSSEAQPRRRWWTRQDPS